MIGAYPLDADDVEVLERLRVDRVLNLVQDKEYPRGQRAVVEAAFADAGIGEWRLDLTDYGGLPPEDIEAAVEEVNQWLDEGAKAYVHCRAGWQRSAAVAAAVVAIRAGLDIDEALNYVQERKPSADPLPHQREDLRKWWDGRQARGARLVHR
jgi:protein-tyrosine phosphatase